jgi:RNA polymerase sigma factor (sigma-70 family)
MPATDSTASVEAVFRLEFPRVVATLAAFVGDIGLAEDLAQDALVDALAQWPRDGAPRNPGAWLTTVGKRRAVDLFRRNRTLREKYTQLGQELERAVALPAGAMDFDPESKEEIADDRLRLMFVSCHQVLPVPARTALTLRLIGGLTVREIARAYVVPESTIAQRIVRAKKTIADAGVPFEVPEGSDRTGRLESVLQVIYLIFNEGYSATFGEDWLRPELCAEALRLGRVLASLAPAEPEVLGLVALMEFQSSRLRARIGPTGAPVLLLDQDRRTWDRLHIGRGEDALARATALGEPHGPYTLQAEIAACHARVFRPEETDWHELVALYGELARTSPSPIVELNRAVAVSMASGPEAALDLVDQLVETGTLERYQLLPSVRGDLLDRLRRPAEAAVEFDRAAALAANTRERALSEERARVCRARAASVESSSTFTGSDGAS